MDIAVGLLASAIVFLAWAVSTIYLVWTLRQMRKEQRAASDEMRERVATLNKTLLDRAELRRNQVPVGRGKG